MSDFKGIFVPHELVEIVGWSIACQLSAFYYSAPNIEKGTMRTLLNKKFIVRKKLKPEDAVYLLCRKEKVQYVHGGYQCEWCKGTSYTLQQHHYPITKANKGKKVVSICANCHAEFHSFVTVGIIVLKSEFEEIFTFTKS